MTTTDVMDRSFVELPPGADAAVEQRSQGSHNNVAVVGILITILIFLLVQTAGIAYWAGQMSSRQETQQKQQDTLQRNFEIIQAQYQQVSNELSAIKAAQLAERKGK